MPKFGYSLEKTAAEGLVVASLREVRCSPKEASELANWLKGCRLPEAREKLERVSRKAEAVPFRRYKRNIPHRRQIQGFPAGRFPVKSAEFFSKLLDSLESNATFKGMDPDKLKIVHFCVQRGRRIENYVPRAFGRASPHFETLSHVEVAAREE